MVTAIHTISTLLCYYFVHWLLPFLFVASTFCLFWFMGVVPYSEHYDSVSAVWVWTGAVQSTRVSLCVLVNHSFLHNLYHQLSRHAFPCTRVCWNVQCFWEISERALQSKNYANTLLDLYRFYSFLQVFKRHICQNHFLNADIRAFGASFGYRNGCKLFHIYYTAWCAYYHFNCHFAFCYALQNAIVKSENSMILFSKTDFF